MDKPILKNEIEAKINGTATVENNIADVKEYALKLKDYYSKLVFSDEQIKEAEDERTSINKMIKKVADYRKDIVAEFKKPIDLFETTAKETEKILKETSDYVNNQVKNYVEKQKAKKKEEIEKLYSSLTEDISISNLINLNMIFDERYLNKTFKIEDIEKDLSEKIQKIQNDIGAIKDLNSEYEVSLTNSYLKTFDLSKVIAENKRLQELKQETQKVEIKQEEIKQEKVTKMLTKEVKTENIDPVKTYTLKITAPLSKQRALKQFLELNNMEFEKVE